MAGDKIREDEIMSDDELDNVAGGTLQDTDKDIEMVGRLGLFNGNPNFSAIKDFYQNNRGALTDMFAKFGIEYTQHEDKGNEYVYSYVRAGQTTRIHLSQEEVWNIIREQLGK